MNIYRLLGPTWRKAIILPIGAFLSASFALAQTAQAPAVDAATLAKYDKNGNGVLDPDEVKAMEADQAAAANKKSSDVIKLTPFEVDSTKDSGYYAQNTLAGSRLNTNLADLAASITVVTKQQMEDTASLNVNDVFRYEANTEGSSRYTPSITDRGTAKDAIAGYSLGNDGSTTTNAQSNRLRGLGAPDASIDYFTTNPRIPFDTYNTQSVEIARGPNPLLFGLGSPSGIVNQTSTQAALDRNTNEVEVRTDQYGSYRAVLSFNRALIKDQLAMFAAFLYDNEQFQRKPSYDLTRRQFGAITYKPFKKTLFRGFAEGFINNADRPNSITPRDFVTPWLQAGRPAYDPITRSVTVLNTGQTFGPYTLNTLSPGYNPAVPASSAALTSTTSPFYVPGITFDDVTRPLERISGANGAIIDYFQRQGQVAGFDYAGAQTNPAQVLPSSLTAFGFAPQDPRYAIREREWTASQNGPQPTANINGTTYTYGTYQFPGVTDPKIYDWRKYNINQTNTGKTRDANYKMELEQEITPDLFFNAGWLRQDIDSVQNYTLSQLTGATLAIDTNVNMPNGAANPYFGKVWVGELGPDTFYAPETDDNFRAMLAYNLDLQKHGGWWRYLGKHRLLGLVSEQDQKTKTERWRQTFLSGDADATLRYLPNTQINNGSYNLWNSQNLARHYYISNPGDPNGVVTQGSGSYNNRGWNTPFNTGVSVYNYGTGQFQTDQVTVGEAFADNGSFTTQREVKSWNLATQSTLFGDRLIATLGLRRDQYRARKTTGGIITKTDGTVVATALQATDIYHYGNGQADYNLVMNRWNRWDKLSGYTKTVGLAFRPLKDWGFTQHLGGEVGSEFLNSLTLYYNNSNNFNPPAVFQTDYFAKPLPKPTGKGEDGGFGFNVLNNKLVARINWYTTSSQNERTAAASTLLTRLAYGDTTLMIPWATAVVRVRSGANTAASNWNTDAANPLSTAQVAQVYSLVGLPQNYYSGTSIGGTQNSEAKGVELQLTYNPLPNWTMKVTGSKQETTYHDIAPQFDAWQAVRMPVWLAATAPDIPDFVDGGGTQYSLKNFWQSYGYTSAALATNTGSSTTAGGYYASVVTSQVALAKALEGVNAPDQRQYHGTLLTNYVFNRGKLKGFSVGGAESYESRASIGYFGKVGDPLNAPLSISVADPTRPVYDNGNYYTDLWIAYSHKIFNGRIGWKLQLNANNITEDGHLEPTAVNFDGKPWAFRIVDSRSFVLTSTFNF